MKGLADYIEQQLSTCPYDKILLEFEQKVMDEAIELEKRVKHAGLGDEKVIFDLVKDSHPDMKSEYAAFRKKRLAELREKKARSILFKGTPIYYILMIAIYLTVSFITKDWGRTWLIIIGMVTLWVDAAGAVTGWQISTKRKIFHPIARIAIALSVMMNAVFVFLAGIILFHITDFWVVFPAGVFAVFWVDALYAGLTKQRMRVINYLAYIPASMPMVYLVLAGRHIIPWHPGWIIIPLSLLIDAAIIIIKLLDNRKYKYKPEEDED